MDAELMARLQANADRAEKPRRVEVDGLGVLYVRPLQIADIDAGMVDDAQPDGTDKQLLAKRVCRLLCDETGARNADADNPEHVAVFARQPFSVLTELTEAARAPVPNG